MKRMTRWLSLLMTAVLLFALAAPGALAAENTVTISTAEELAALAQKCTLDTWSQGKTVILAADLNLSGKSFAPIPTFGGTFQGSGHTISGLTLNGSGNVRGLFRYLQSGATVQDLAVEGSIRPSDRQDDLGLLAGSNAGRIVNCSAKGIVSGDNRIGGLIGVNEAGGELVGCKFSGSVTGKHSAGGIVGENHGTLTLCQNDGHINTKDLEDDPKTDYTNLAQLNSMENLPAYTDVGGIAGLSDGTIQSCTNTGSVGYDQIGYNIGGIAGRQSGWLDGCTNTGSVYGRKDVGGIVGQLEPEVLKTFSEDFLDRLLAQLDALADVMDRTANHADGISDSVHRQMNDLSDKTRAVKDIASDLTDAVTDWANGSIDQANELSARISWSIDQLNGIMDDAVDLMDDVDDLVRELKKLRPQLESAAGNAAGGTADLAKAMDDLNDANTALKTALNALSDAMQKVVDALQGSGDLTDALDSLAKAAGNFNRALGLMNDALTKIRDGLKDLSDMASDLKAAMKQMEEVNKELDSVTDGLAEVTKGLRDMLSELSEKPDIKIDPIGSDITDKGDALQDAMDALLDSGDALNSLLSDSADTLIGDLKAINSQFRAITDLIRSEKSDWDNDRDKSVEDQIRDRVQDVSDTCDAAKQHDGRVSGSENQGAVAGSSNAGGVIGSVGLELDFDPDTDMTSVGEYSLNFHYQGRALVSECVNSGAVNGRNDYAGGIVGLAELGRITACEGYGAVSTDSSYAGGIVGSSEGSIDGCWAKCSVSGQDYVGAVAGYADSMTNCRALGTVTGEAYTGAVAGDVSEDGTVTGNLFTHETLGGIDGISYTGIAEPVDFDTLCTSGAPRLFTQLELTFRADGEVVAVMPFRYGHGIDKLPDIPAKKGCSAMWPELDYAHLTASQTVDAVYTPYSSALTDSADGLPQLLVDGSFGANAQVSHTSEEVTWTDDRGTVHSGTAVTVTVEDPDFEEISYTVHYRLPESGKRYDLWVKAGDGWEKQESTVDGSYLLFTSTENTVTFCLQEHAVSQALWVILGVLALAAVLLVIFLIRRKRGKVLKVRLRRLKKSTKVQ